MKQGGWRRNGREGHRFSVELPGGGSRDGEAAGGGEAADFEGGCGWYNDAAKRYRLQVVAVRDFSGAAGGAAIF